MDQKLVFAVAQRPFSTGGFHFCFLLPLCDLTGAGIDASEDFPNNGLCWFMLRDLPFQGVSPGQLVVGFVEHTRDWQSSNLDKSWYQLRLDTAQMAGAPNTIVEVLDAGPMSPDGPRALLAPQREIGVDHRPSEMVLAQMGSRLYGPFKAKARPSMGDALGDWRVTLERTSRQTVWEVEVSAAESAGALIRSATVEVSLDDKVPEKSTQVRSIQYRFMPWGQFEELKASEAAEVELFSDSELLARAAKEHLKPKSKRQQLLLLLRELEGNLRPLPDALSAGALAATKRLSSHLSASERLGDELVDALMKSGVLDERIEKYKEERFSEYLQSRATEAESLIGARVREAQERHEHLVAELSALSTRVGQDREAMLRDAKDQVRKLREDAEAEIESERNRVKEQRDTLLREQLTISESISSAAARFGEGRSDLLADLLALVPALRATGVLEGPASQPEGGSPAPVPDRPLDLPGSFATKRDKSDRPLEERGFFERLCRHVEGSGFLYSDSDLLTFHLSVKTCDLTVLGGLSGVGKSSLVRLYAEATAGEDLEGRARLLNVWTACT